MTDEHMHGKCPCLRLHKKRDSGPTSSPSPVETDLTLDKIDYVITQIVLGFVSFRLRETVVNSQCPKVSVSLRSDLFSRETDLDIDQVSISVFQVKVSLRFIANCRKSKLSDLLLSKVSS